MFITMSMEKLYIWFNEPHHRSANAAATVTRTRPRIQSRAVNGRQCLGYTTVKLSFTEIPCTLAQFHSLLMF
ncbi:hypothetical protein G9C98_007248 [Cotesia typhae]|uniref:Uncharacterized protein n=1 Tax=Cotesia typhae TaxID=2053667 RepID=A0A8J5VDF4_9HYME|nr:hypothetical protein G9C98_007248 [Cotesia typhae]